MYSVVMPSRNVVKQFVADKMYHVYNRGVEGRDIFMDERDYAVFLSFLKFALLSDSENQNNEVVDQTLISQAERFTLRRKGLADKVDLVSYCLMPNHFHLLFYQHTEEGITELMRSVITGYVLYFNKRHKRTGSLFQGVYKASPINTDPYWWHVSRYIHLNPLDLGVDYKDYPYSSYRFFAKKAEAEWVKPDIILSGFRSAHSYEHFVEEYIPQRNELLEIKNVLANSQELTVQG